MWLSQRLKAHFRTASAARRGLAKCLVGNGTGTSICAAPKASAPRQEWGASAKHGVMWHRLLTAFSLMLAALFK